MNPNISTCEETTWCRSPDAIGREVTITVLSHSGFDCGNSGWISWWKMEFIWRLGGSSSHPSSMKRTSWQLFASILAAICWAVVVSGHGSRSARPFASLIAGSRNRMRITSLNWLNSWPFSHCWQMYTERVLFPHPGAPSSKMTFLWPLVSWRCLQVELDISVLEYHLPSSDGHLNKSIFNKPSLYCNTLYHC